MATIVASGTTELASSSFTLVQGESTTLFITTTAGGDAPSGSSALVQIQAAGTQWMNIGSLGQNTPSRLLVGPGTFRVFRTAGGTAYGVDRI